MSKIKTIVRYAGVIFAIYAGTVILLAFAVFLNIVLYGVYKGV